MRLLSALLITGAVLLIPLTVASAAPKSGPFVGNWTAIDKFDDSNLTLVVKGQGAGKHPITLFDDRATACGGGTATAKDVGTVTGNVLSATLKVKCANGSFVPDTPYTFTYDPSTGKLTDSYGVVWSRA